MAFDGKERRSSRRSPQVGNVIYVNFGARDYTPVAGRDTFTDPDAPSHKPRRKTTRARATVKRTRSTAADWLTDLAFTQSDNGRMSRGRGYYQGGHPYKARYYCDCPDKAKVCKHVVATMMAAADRVAADPGLVFQLRGLNLADMRLPKQSTKPAGSAGSVPATPETSAPAGASGARQKPQAEAPSPEAIAAATDRFWNGGPLPEIPQLKTQSALADSDEELLHKAMRTISYTSVDELCAVSDIEDLYYNLTHET